LKLSPWITNFQLLRRSRGWLRGPQDAIFSRANSWDIRGEFIGIMGNLLGNLLGNHGKILGNHDVVPIISSMGAIPHWMV